MASLDTVYKSILHPQIFIRNITHAWNHNQEESEENTGWSIVHKTIQYSFKLHFRTFCTSILQAVMELSNKGAIRLYAELLVIIIVVIIIIISSGLCLNNNHEI